MAILWPIELKVVVLLGGHLTDGFVVHLMNAPVPSRFKLKRRVSTSGAPAGRFVA